MALWLPVPLEEAETVAAEEGDSAEGLAVGVDDVDEDAGAAVAVSVDGPLGEALDEGGPDAVLL